MELQSERLLIREYQESDWKAVHAYAKLDYVSMYEAWGPNSEFETKNFIAVVSGQATIVPRRSYDLAIMLSAENKLIGGCRFSFDEEHPGEPSIGYIINPAYWNKGYATEATITVINYLSTLSNVKAIRATCDKLNIASQKVLEKCGLRLTSEIIDDFHMKGRLRDTFMYKRNFPV